MPAHAVEPKPAPERIESAAPRAEGPPIPQALRPAEPGTAFVGPPLPASVAPTAAAGNGLPTLRPAPVPVKLSQDPRPAFTADTYLATLRAAEAYRGIAEAGGWPVLPAGPAMKAGDRGPGVAALKARLAASDDLPLAALPGDVFDSRIVEAVQRFQSRHGLPESGLVAARTLAALNVPADIRARQLAGSARRIAESKFPFGERYVVVNIPSATVEAVERGEVARRYVAVVGKRERASPTIEARIQNVNFNPTWTLPVSIVKKDIVPRQRKDPGHLAKMHIRILDGYNREIDPATLDWSTDAPLRYTFRQDPGTSNSLGQVRIDMPNKLAVYMHDTPSKGLFARDDRFHSSGCVRVADVRAFTEWLLQGTPNPDAPGGPTPWTAGDIDAAIAAGVRRDVRLTRHVPVAWVYLTGYATADGTVHFRDDVYGLDRPDAAPLPQPSPDDLVTSSIKKPTL
ncbi:L,D-transpeptidase family protein [Salinarimonas soli]|uniref:L,D-transpeptidase family protein n=2 Tax=Salinarimonas soli TaxID=1638099 RepID=A0A5B2VDB4_9HYPH|nr:L,D-transpeptidase family protein [Salinarimonas soli]